MGKRFPSLVALLACGIGAALSHGGIMYTDLYTVAKPAGVTSINLTSIEMGPSGEVFGQGIAGSTQSALLWSSSAPSGANLKPSAFTGSAFLYGGSATQCVGAAGSTSSFNAALWTSPSASSYVNLHSNAWFESRAFATDGTHQVGWARTSQTHAMVWNGTLASVIDLHPAGFTYSQATGVAGAQEVGEGSAPSTGGQFHGMLWTGSAASYVDLNPSGFLWSNTWSTSGSQQVGIGGITSTSDFHALLWTGTAGSAVDLSPNGFTASLAIGTNGTYQVGRGSISASPLQFRALLWSGSAASAVDLHSVLPADFVSSQAFSVFGDTVYGYAVDTAGNTHAIAWTVPEPVGLSLITFGVLSLRRYRK